MSDFSRFGGVAEYWDIVFSSSPRATLPEGLSALEQRRLTNLYRESASLKYTQLTKDDVLVRDFTCKEAVTIRVYEPKVARHPEKRPIYVWYHGGGLLNGSLSAEDSHCFKIVLELDVLVVHVCYRHTPEYEWPAQAEDAMAGLNWVFDHIDSLRGDMNKVMVAGRSAGGLLAAGVVLQDMEKHGASRLCGQILDMPVLCHSKNFPNHLIAPGKGSYEEHKHGPGLSASRHAFFETLAGELAQSDRLYNPLTVEGEAWSGTPRTHFQIAGRDILRGHAFLFMQKLQSVGTQTSFNVYKGIPHGFIRWKLEASKAWQTDHYRAIRSIFELQG